jgi:hypothetical protein
MICRPSGHHQLSLITPDNALDAQWYPIKNMESSVVLSRDVATVALQAALITCRQLRCLAAADGS